MTNMSYCKFHNTARDLEDCVEDIRNENINELSSYERRGLMDILDLAQEILDLEHTIEDGINNSISNLK